MDVVVGVHSRDVKTALFVALNGVESVTIVAVAGSTAELLSYSQTFRPDVVVVEEGLTGQPLVDVLDQMEAARTVGKILIIDGGAGLTYANVASAEIFADVDHLVQLYPELIHEDRNK